MTDNNKMQLQAKLRRISEVLNNKVADWLQQKTRENAFHNTKTL